MPNIKSAIKAHRQSLRRKARNIQKKRVFRSEIKIYRKLISEGKADEAKAELSKVFKALDKAAKTNTIKQNKASRLKSRLSKLAK